MSPDLSPLRRQLSKADSLVLDLPALQDYRHDATEFAVDPAGVLLAESRDDVTAAVGFCREAGIPITARGTGTGLSGGCVSAPGGLIVSVERMTALKIDRDRRTAVCGPGVITKRLQDSAAQYQLTYLPDPASYAECTLGGNVAEGAGGLRCKRYGVTKDYVLGLEIVLADGSLLRTGFLGGNRGLSMGDIMIGSEGTLGIITEIAVRLDPIPSLGTTILAIFPGMRDAAQTVTDITTSGLVTTVMEFVDGDAVACANSYEPSAEFEDSGALLLIEASGESTGDETARIEQLCEANGALKVRSEPDPERAEELWRIRRNLSKAVKSIAAYAISEDVVVPNSRFPELVAFVADLNASSPLRINSFGHAGDGNLHVYFISSTGSDEDRRLIELSIEQLMGRTVELGGTITGEHGIGLAKREYLTLEFDDPSLRAMRAMRDIFDPERLFNPDKLLVGHS